MNPPIQKEAALALVTKLKVNSSDQGKYLDWLARLMMLGIETSEVLSAEIFAPFTFRGTEWILVQRFHTPEQIETWRKSNERQKLINELAPYLSNNEITLSESTDSTQATGGSISIAILTHVKKGYEKTYLTYETKYQAAQARAPGYHGAYVQAPAKDTEGTWITIIRFDSPQAMDKWFASDERKKLVAESEQLVSSTDFQNVTTSFPGWFPAEANADKGPPNWKTAMLILLGLYPGVMLVIKYFLPLLHGSPIALNNFIGNILTVAFTTWITMPLFIKVYKSWLFPNESTPKWVSPVSLISILFFFAIEVAFFWRYF